MALDPLRFETPEAYSAFDFSPLMKLGQQLQQQRQQQAMLDALGRTYGNQQPGNLAPSTPSSSYGPLPSSLPANPSGTVWSGSLPPVGVTPDAVPSGSVLSAPLAPPARETAYTGNKQAVAQSVTGELRTQGFSEPAIAGILYNIGQESNFDPTLRHPDQPRYGGEAHYAHGLFQEGGDEWNTMAAHLQDRNWQDPVEQARFVAGRLKGDIGNQQYAEVLRALQAARTPEEAAKIFARGYLKPADRYLNSRMADISRGIPGVGFYTGE
jgi:hypothetical protein